MLPRDTDPTAFWVALVMLALPFWGGLLIQWLSCRNAVRSMERSWNRGGHHVMTDPHFIDPDNRRIKGLPRAARALRTKALFWLALGLIYVVAWGHAVATDSLPRLAPMPASVVWALNISLAGAVALSLASGWWAIKAIRLIRYYDTAVPKELARRG